MQCQKSPSECVDNCPGYAADWCPNEVAPDMPARTNPANLDWVWEDSGGSCNPASPDTTTGVTTYSNWGEAQPDNGGSTDDDEKCVNFGFGDSNTWNDASCVEEKAWLCERSVWTHVRAGSKYAFMAVPQTFEQAKTDCQSIEAGSNLVMYIADNHDANSAEEAFVRTALLGR